MVAACSRLAEGETPANAKSQPASVKAGRLSEKAVGKLLLSVRFLRSRPEIHIFQSAR
jgi:hypothetical protein